jgi:hypothetical protein
VNVQNQFIGYREMNSRQAIAKGSSLNTMIAMEKCLGALDKRPDERDRRSSYQ